MSRLHLTRNLRSLAFLLTLVAAIAAAAGLWWANHTGLPEPWRATIEREVAKQGAFIKIGSLNDLCKDLGLSTGGKNKAIVKKGMLQNASAFISAKLKYRTSDGGERTLEAGFTPFSTRAVAVAIWRYLDGPWHPLGQVAFRGR